MVVSGLFYILYYLVGFLAGHISLYQLDYSAVRFWSLIGEFRPRPALEQHVELQRRGNEDAEAEAQPETLDAQHKVETQSPATGMPKM